jgi:hypothetical protein
MLQFLKSVLQLKYTINYFSVDILVASKHLRFHFSSNEESSEIRYPVFGVRAVDGLTNKTVVLQAGVEFHISNVLHTRAIT